MGAWICHTWRVLCAELHSPCAQKPTFCCCGTVACTRIHLRTASAGTCSIPSCSSADTRPRMQAAVHAPVLDTLHTHFDTCMECFASPLNCRWPRFCSLFADTDAPFGSLGSFFKFRPSGGSFQANPPFDKACVSQMAAHIFKLLLQTDVRPQVSCPYSLA